MTTESDVEFFLSIAMPLLPVLWIILALQTSFLRDSLKEAHKEWRRVGGWFTKAKFRATFWSAATSMCFALGAGAEIIALVSILWG